MKPNKLLNELEGSLICGDWDSPGELSFFSIKNGEFIDSYRNFEKNKPFITLNRVKYFHNEKNGKSFVFNSASDYGVHSIDLNEHKITTFKGHTDDTQEIDIFQKRYEVEQFLLSCSMDGSLRLWDEHGKCLKVYKHKNQTVVRCCSSFNEGRFFISSDIEDSISLWDFEKGSVPIKTKMIDYLWDFELCESNQLLFGSGYGNFSRYGTMSTYVVDMRTFETVLKVKCKNDGSSKPLYQTMLLKKENPIYVVTGSNDDRNNEWTLYDFRNMKKPICFKKVFLSSKIDHISDGGIKSLVRISGNEYDNRKVFASCTRDGLIQLWDVDAEGENMEILRIEKNNGAYGMDYIPENSKLLQQKIDEQSRKEYLFEDFFNQDEKKSMFKKICFFSFKGNKKSSILALSILFNCQ